MLVLLDLRVAFDAIDYSILISSLEHWVGIFSNGFNPILIIEYSPLVLVILLQLQLLLRAVSFKAVVSLLYYYLYVMLKAYLRIGILLYFYFPFLGR